MSVTGFFGMRGTGDWATDERPKSFRQGILKLYPNGMTPLTAITSMLTSEKVDDPEYKWWKKDLALQGGALTAAGALYTDEALSSAKNAAVSAGEELYVKMPEATHNHFRPGHTVILVDSSDDDKYIFAKVISKKAAGASSYVKVKAITAQTTSTVANLVDYIDIVGNANPEGGYMPEAISYFPTKFTNYTQIFRTPLDITRTARRLKLRTGDAYSMLKMEALEYHGIEMELAFLRGDKSETVGDNGKPERTTQGLIPFLVENLSGNIHDWVVDGATTWALGGEDWLDDRLEEVFRYGRQTKLGLCGSGALLAIQKLTKGRGEFRFDSMTGAYGIKVTKWTTPFGDLMLKTHPLMTGRSTYMRKNILILEPENLRYRYVDDTVFKSDVNKAGKGETSYDGTKEEYITECGMEFHNPETAMYLQNLGDDAT